MIDGLDLQSGQAAGRLFPTQLVLTIGQEFSWGFVGEPPIPIRPTSQNPREIFREEFHQLAGNGEFSLVGLTYCLKPQGGTVRRKSNQAKRGAGVQLPEFSGEMEAHRPNHRVAPGAQFTEPCQASKSAGACPYDLSFA